MRPAIKSVTITHTLNEKGETVGKWYAIRYESGKLTQTRKMPKTLAKWIKDRKFNHYRCEYPVMYGKVYKVEFLRK